MKNLSTNLSKLYEIYYSYSMIYLQQTDKKEEIVITFQDVMHFLKFYEIIQDSSNLFSFIEFYDTDEIRTKTLKVGTFLSFTISEQH